MSVPDDFHFTPEEAAVIDALPLIPMEVPDRSYVAVANRLRCSPEKAADRVKDLEHRGLIELICNQDGKLSDEPLHSSWTWRVTPRWE